MNLCFAVDLGRVTVPQVSRLFPYKFSRENSLLFSKALAMCLIYLKYALGMATQPPREFKKNGCYLVKSEVIFISASSKLE